KIVKVGDSLKYVITVQNKNPNSNVTNVVVKDPLPAGLQPITGSLQTTGVATSEETLTNNEVIVKAASIKSDEQLVITFDVEVLADVAATVTNVATISADGLNPDNPSVSVKVAPKPSLTKTAD